MVEDKHFIVHPFNPTNLFYEVCRFIISTLLSRQQACSLGAIQVDTRVPVSDANIYPGIDRSHASVL